MDQIQSVWNLVIALAAVINGLGIVRLIGGLGEYIKKRDTLEVRHHWAFSLQLLFQLLAHILLWWSFLGLRSVGEINFLTYVYLLIGPTMLFLSTSLIVPDTSEDVIDMVVLYRRIRDAYYSILALFWLWTIFVWPVFGYGFPPTINLLATWLLIAVVLRFSKSAIVHQGLIIGNFLVMLAFIALYGLKLAGVGTIMTG